MKIKLRKVDAIIIIVMLAVAGLVFYNFGYLPEKEKQKIPDIELVQDLEKRILYVKSISTTVLWSDIEITGTCDKSDLGKYVTKGDKITDCSDIIVITHKPTSTELGSWNFPPPPDLPSSLVLPNDRDVSPEDEGTHFKKIANTREWWYFTVVFSEDSELPGWSATIGFLHMAWGDLKLTFKPDVLVVTLHSPDGKEYGGMINKKRGGLIGLLGTLTLDAQTPGVDLKYEDSWAKGDAPEWHVHAEDKDIDTENEIVIDLDYFAPANPIWIHSSRLLDKGEGNIADYIFLGCQVEGTVKLDNLEFKVKGTGHHQHSWSPGFLNIPIKGWDWCHITLSNGWNIYYSNYYLTRQIASTKTSTINPLATVIITTDSGAKITKLEDIDITIEKSDKLFLILKIPNELKIKAKPKALTQPLLRSYDIKLELDIKADNTYEKIWKFPTYVGMKVGRNLVTGKITWSDDGEQEIELKGTGTIWFTRSF